MAGQEMHFSDRLIDAVVGKSPLIVGIDPNLEYFPKELLPLSGTKDALESSLLSFCRVIVDSVQDLVPAVKFQSAYFEQFGTTGIKALQAAASYAKQCGLLVILDAKRGDIDATSLAYARGYLGGRTAVNGLEFVSDMEVDALTVNPFLGEDGVQPFVDVAIQNGKGIFVLVKTSNPGSGMLQGVTSESGTISEKLARLVATLGANSIGTRGYSLIGAVVGATYPAEAEVLRALMPRAIILVPGTGAQGGSIEAAMANFNADGLGAVISISRGVTYPSEEEIAVSGFGGAVRRRLEKFLESYGEAAEKVGYGLIAE